MEQMIAHVGVVSSNTFNYLKKLDELWSTYGYVEKDCQALNQFYSLLIVLQEARKLLLVCWKSVTILSSNDLQFSPLSDCSVVSVFMFYWCSHLYFPVFVRGIQLIMENLQQRNFVLHKQYLISYIILKTLIWFKHT